MTSLLVRSNLMKLASVVALLPLLGCDNASKKTVEATEMLDLLKKGAASYYSSKQVSRETGNVVYCQFPAPQPLTPPSTNGKHPCCDPANDKDGDHRCDAAPGNWNTPTWSALKFAITDAHYYAYEVKSEGTLKTAKYTVTAYGDLDCDGTWSTFQLVGQGDPNATGANCDAVSPAAMFRADETE